MKTIPVITLFLFAFSSLFSQINSRRGFEYLAEFADTNMLYTDVYCNNYDNLPVSAIGNDRTEIAISYSSSNGCQNALYMISVHRSIAAVNFTELYIFNAFQELAAYVYLMDEVEVVCKIENNDIITLREKNREDFATNYFVPEEMDYLNLESIKSRASGCITRYCSVWLNMPDVDSEVSRVRQLYNNTNSDSELLQRKVDNLTVFYKEGFESEYFKIVLVDDRTQEYYFNNGELYFVFCTASDEIPELRFYCYKDYPFKILYGKENLRNDDEKFCDYSEWLMVQRREILGILWNY